MFRFNRRVFSLLVILSMLGLNLTACGIGRIADKESIVAKVDGHGITEKEFNDELQMLRDVHRKQFGEDALSKKSEGGRTYGEVLRDDLLESMILEKLIANEMEELNIVVTDEEIEEEIRTQYIEGLGGEDKYRGFLKENNFTQEFLKNNTRKSMMDRKYREYIFKNTHVSEDETREYFDTHKNDLIQVKISMIQVRSPKTASIILEKLEKGEDFHELATTRSMDPLSAIQGGNMGYISKGTLKELPEVEKVAFSMKPGEVSEVIEAQAGYYIILTKDRKEDYKELREDIASRIKEEKYIKGLSELKSKANIKRYIKGNK